MAHHSSILAWKIPWMEEPFRLQSMGSLRVRHDWATSLSLFTFMHWRRRWQPTPVFLLGKSHGWRSLVGYSPWHHKESNMTEQFHFHFLFNNFLYFIGQRRKDIWLQKRKELWGWKREVLVIEEGVTNQRIIWPSKGKKGKEMDYPLDLKKEWTLPRPWLWTVKWI